MSEQKHCTGRIADIQHFSVHDGPGIRTSVFLKGCNLRCLWCHNPENILCRDREISFVPARCIGCGACFKACPNGCHVMEDGRHVIRWDNCAHCGRCTRECYTRALTVVGREATPGEVVQEVLRDKMFYDTSGGGITLSGGEPMLQPDFVREVLRLCRENGVHTALETCGVYPYERLDGVREYVDLFLFDYKATGAELHKKCTGVDNHHVLENLEKLHADGCNVLIRCPMIPGINDTDEHFRAIAELTLRYPSFQGTELLPYHRLGVSKITRFGLAGQLPHQEFVTPDKATVQQWIAAVRGYGGRLVNE